jgi:HD-like signal output (HDOD) protein
LPRVPLQFAKPTMRLAQPVFDRDGMLVAGSGTLLTERLVRLLRHLALQTVTVDEADDLAAWETIHPLDEEIAALARRFGAAPTSEPMLELRRAVARRLARRAAALGTAAASAIVRAAETSADACAAERGAGQAATDADATASGNEAGDALAPAAGGELPSLDALKRQVSRLKKIHTLPRLLERVLAALDDPDVDFNNVAELVEVDPALSSQLLRLANSSFYSSAGSIGLVSRALVMLGTVVTRSVAVTSAVLDPAHVGVRGFWEHSLGCAVAAGALSKATGLCAPEELTAAGLLHDLGKVVLYQEMPEAFALVLARARQRGTSFREAELEVLGVDHAEVASWFVERWGFPARLAEPILYHHDPERALRARNETAVVHVANTLVRALGFGFGGDDLVPPLEVAAWERLHLTEPLLDRALEHFDVDLDHALNYALFD